MLVYSEDFWLYYQWLKVFSSSWNENYNSQCFYQKKVVAYSHWKERQVIIFLHHGIFYWDAFCSRSLSRNFWQCFDHSWYLMDLEIFSCFNLHFQQLVFFRDIMGIPWCTMSSCTSFDTYSLEHCQHSQQPYFLYWKTILLPLVSQVQLQKLLRSGDWKPSSIHNNKSSKYNFKALLEQFFTCHHNHWQSYCVKSDCRMSKLLSRNICWSLTIF